MSERKVKKAKKSKSKPPPHTVELETVDYFKRIESIVDEIEQKFDSDEDKEVFFDNVIKELDGKELKICQDPECSPVLEKFIKCLGEVHIAQVFNKISPFLVDLCFHKNGSHVVQTLFCTIPFLLEYSEKGEEIEKTFLNACSLLLESWFDLTFDFYGSHILRAVLNVLSGQKVDSLLRSNYSTKFQSERNNDPLFEKNSKKSTLPIFKTHLEVNSEIVRKTPPSFEKKLKSIIEGMIEESEKDIFSSMAVDSVASPVLQLMLFINSKNEILVQKIIDKILDGTEEKKDQEDFFETLMKHQIGSRVAEAIIFVSPQKQFLKLFDRSFHGKLLNLIEHPCANYVVGTLIHYLKNESQLGITTDELESQFDRLLHHDRVGIVQHLVSTCVRLKSHEKKVFQMIAKGLNCTSDKKDMVKCVVYLQKLEYLEKSKKIPQNHGSAIAQGIFMFPISVSRPIIDSFLALPNSELVEWCKDQQASHTVEAFLSSKSIDIPSKTRLIKKLKGSLVEIAVTKFGSHVIDSLWHFSDLSQKEKIVSELAEKDKELQNSFHGKFVYRNCRVGTFKQKREDWVQKEMSSITKKEMFKDIIETDETSIEDQIRDIEKKEDPTMTKLGYQNASKLKGKKAKESENNMKLILEEDEETLPEKRKRFQRDEIDDLFKGKRFKIHKEDQKERETDQEEIKDKKSKNDKSIQVVMSAIEATTKKKKKKEKEIKKSEKVKEKGINTKREPVLKETKIDKAKRKEKKFSMN